MLGQKGEPHKFVFQNLNNYWKLLIRCNKEKALHLTQALMYQS